jgi:hypothetical protein
MTDWITAWLINEHADFSGTIILDKGRYPFKLLKYVWDDTEIVFRSETNYLEKRDLVKKEETFTLTT